MDTPIFRRDQQFGDMLFDQLKATNEVAAAAHKAGYERGLIDGRIEAFNEVLAIMDKNKVKAQAG